MEVRLTRCLMSITRVECVPQGVVFGSKRETKKDQPHAKGIQNLPRQTEHRENSYPRHGAGRDGDPDVLICRKLPGRQTSALGLARIEIQDEFGKPVEGFAMEDCDRIFTANTTAREVAWNGSSDVSKLTGRKVRLRFELSRHAKLYSFKFSE